MTTYKVGYFVGSLSSKSINRILSKALIRLAPNDLEFSEVPICRSTARTTTMITRLRRPL
jgi:NAD(P)H-dependent FMN reductase